MHQKRVTSMKKSYCMFVVVALHGLAPSLTIVIYSTISHQAAVAVGVAANSNTRTNRMTTTGGSRQSL